MLAGRVGLPHGGRNGNGGRGSCCTCAGLDRRWVLPQTVEGGYLIGDGSERCDLHVTIVRNLGHLLVIFAERFALLTQLIVAFSLEEHAGVRTGEANYRKRANDCCSHETVSIAEGQRDLSDTTVFVSSNKQNVIALTQHILPSSTCDPQDRNLPTYR